VSSKKASFTVSEVARMANISVRALHHYDEIGLLCPSGRSRAGYRLYAPADLQRLQQVMSWKVLGFPLEEIRRLLGNPEFDMRAALLLQRRLLAEKAERVQTLIAAVDAALAALAKGRKKMDGTKLFEAFGDFDPTLYEEEVNERWSNTDAYRESARRTAQYTKEQWAQLKDESDRIYRGLAAQLEAGASPADPAAMDLAERHRLHIERWFYPCASDLHRGLGELYVSDPRFTKNIDRYRSGLASFLRDAISANADRKTEAREK
jgi:DNA-binding transcriptional MerR regulator